MLKDRKIVGSKLIAFLKGSTCPYKGKLGCSLNGESSDKGIEQKIKEVCKKFRHRCAAEDNIGPFLWYDIVNDMKKRVVRD